MVVGTPDVITHENFGDDRIRDFGTAAGQILPFPIDFDRRPYNTLALPCECVMYVCIQGVPEEIAQSLSCNYL